MTTYSNVTPPEPDGTGPIASTDESPTPAAPVARVEVKRAHDREHHHSGDGILGRFSFPFTGNFDLTKYAHGALLVHNDDVIDPRAGVDPHRHAEMEIVTWIVDGSVIHQDTAGHRAELHAGTLQRMSAGTGLLHSEHNPSADTPAQVVQMWVPPDTPGLDPSYAEVDLTEALASGHVVTALSGRDGEDAGIGIANRWVALDIVRPRPGRPVTITSAPSHHLYVTRGSATVRIGGSTATEGLLLSEGDALRTRWSGPLTITSGPEDTEVLAWRMHANF